jgi:DNA-binding response OmpR family regulator
MSKPVDSAELPTRIRAQLFETEQRIADLIAVRDGLLRVYARVGSQDKDSTNEIRANSYSRLLIERAILEALEAAGGKLIPTKKLFTHACAASPKLKYNTFRSHLSRLRERGLIATEARAHGFWKLSGAAPGARLGTS